ncbi:o-succinylbenzoate--CoA ligase [Gordonia sp. FQ]|uniref:o-succinylbenzoate--CoA ligase n=1 Tax=Gordonia sp. FQ TaxID=3446634 RepID=UPI003F873B8F
MLDVRRELSSLLDGTAAYLPVPAGDDRTARMLADTLGARQQIDGDAALVVSTSGSTGTPKGAVHTAASLHASADGTAAALGGPGSWLLALPPHHIAGLQVLLRSLAAGYDPVVLDLSGGFDPAVLPAAIDAMTGPRRYTSLVPLQLGKALGDPEATRALAGLDAILIGGAATPAPLRNAAVAAGLPIVRTYGMSETAGGCVYDGVPLPGALMRIAEPAPDGTGRVELGGATLARGYRNLPGHPAFAEAGWFRTDDLGTIDDGVLSIVGRADEAISTGGLTVVPQVVEAVIDALPGVAHCAVFGVPDERLGEAIAVAVVPDGTAPSADKMRHAVAARLDRYAAPRHVVVVDELPVRGPGKVDRRALRQRFCARKG